MKPTSSTHPWRTWYDRSLTSPGKDGQCLSALSPERRTLFGGDDAGDQLHEIERCIEGGGVAGTFNLMRSGSGDGRCQGAGQADDAVGAACALAAHDGDRNIRQIRR